MRGKARGRSGERPRADLAGLSVAGTSGAGTPAADGPAGQKRACAVMSAANSPVIAGVTVGLHWATAAR